MKIQPSIPWSKPDKVSKHLQDQIQEQWSKADSLSRSQKESFVQTTQKLAKEVALARPDNFPESSQAQITQTVGSLEKMIQGSRKSLGGILRSIFTSAPLAALISDSYDAAYGDQILQRDESKALHLEERPLARKAFMRKNPDRIDFADNELKAGPLPFKEGLELLKKSELPNFNKFDLNNDKTVGVRELDAYADGKELSLKDTLALLVARDILSKESNKDMGYELVDWFNLEAFMLDPRPESNSNWSESVARVLTSVNPEGLSDKVYGAEGKPIPHSLEQGNTGDCWLLAPLSNKTSKEIQAMIKPLKEGTFEVTLPGQKPQVVNKPNLYDQSHLAKSNGFWGNLIEKATRNLYLDKIEQDPDQAKTLYSDPIRGGYTSQGLALLSDNESIPQYTISQRKQNPPAMQAMGIQGQDKVLNSPQKLHQKLTQAFSQENENLFEVVAATEHHPQGIHENAAYPNHAYSVLNYDPGEKLVTLRNPWGKDEPLDQDGTNDGVFDLPLMEFLATFDEIGFSKKPPKS